jgi:LysR family transcriptional activator of nhaA
MYNYNHLYYFYTTVKSGGVTLAAEHLLISQPSLSGQLKVLEDFLQIKLFKKVGRKNILTPEGTLVFGFCRQMFELAEEMHELITEKIPYASRRIYVGVSSEVSNSFVVEVISHFLNKYSDKLKPKVTLISGSHQKLAEQLKFREIDAVVSHLSMTTNYLENIQRVEVPVNLICSIVKKSPQKKRSSDIKGTLKRLSGESTTQWVMPNAGSKLRTEINQFFDEHSIKGRIVFESDVIESLTRSVVDKIGFSFLPLIYVPKELENRSIISIGPKAGYWKHQIYLASHVKNGDDHLIKALGLALKEVCDPLIKRS